jgi:hypothetical protein
MEKLSRELKKFLYEVTPHDDESGYFRTKFEALPAAVVEHEAGMIFELVEKKMINIATPLDSIEFEIRPFQSSPRQGVTIVHADGLSKTISFPPTFVLTSDGRNYRKEARKETALWFFGILLTAILSGLFAVVFTAIVTR